VLFIPGESREDPVGLIRRHRYEAAVAVWNKDLQGSKVDEKSLRALKGTSLAYFRLGSLYQEYQKFSSAIMEEYYGALVEVGASAISLLYLGQIQYQAGSYADAKESFEKAKKLGGGGAGVMDMADVFLFHSKKRLGEVSGDMTQGLKDNGAQWEALGLKDPGASGIPSGLAAQSQRARRAKLQLLLRGSSPSLSEIEPMLKLVLGDAQNPEMFLDEGKSTQINFYDPFLLETISTAYFTLSKLTNLRLRDDEKKFPELAGKFNTEVSLAEAAAKLGQWKEAASYLDKNQQLDAQLVQAKILARTNKPGESRALLESLAAKFKSPSEKRDIADCYYLLGFDLEKGAKLAGEAVKERNSPIYYRTYANLLFAMGRTEAAMQQYAKGYKIEYRNRIDQIDPEYMNDYAFAIFKTNKLRYEEIVETLYHLQKEFPACRQMHYCMQGISAGLARSYESQRIFRKGG